MKLGFLLCIVWVVTHSSCLAAATSVYQPEWNIPDAAHNGFVPPTVKPTAKSLGPSDGYSFLATPVTTTQAAQPLPPLSPALPGSWSKNMMGPKNLAPNPGQSGQTYDSYNEVQPQSRQPVMVLALPSKPTEQLFADLHNQVQGDMLTWLNAKALPAQPLLMDNAAQDWLEAYQHTQQLTPLPQAGQHLLLLESNLDNHHTREPGTALGWFRWLVTDTLPSSLQYRLVVTARLVDAPTGRLLWQAQQSVGLPNQQLTSLNRSINRVPGNRLALSQASLQACQTLADQVRLATGQTSVTGYVKNRGIASLKRLPATIRQQFSP